MPTLTNPPLECILRNRAFRALATEQARIAQIAALQSKVDALKHNLAIEASEAQINLDEFAKSDCRKFTGLFIAKLPRELRDMVYQYLNKGTEKRIDGDYFKSTRDPVTKCYSFSCARWKALHHPEHFRDSGYVSEDFLREISENYYRTSTFIFDDSKGVISKFLNTDEMGLGFAPKTFVSNIETHIRAYSSDRGSFQAYMYGLVKSPERLQASFDGMAELRHCANICVHFLTESKSEKERDELLLVAIPTLLSRLEMARSAGYKVRLILDKEVELKLGTNSLDDWREQLRCLQWPPRGDKS